MKRYRTVKLRHALLSVNGVGYETADDILLYAFHRKVFVIDAYTRRIFSRLGIVAADWGYEQLREFFEERLQAESVAMFNQYHALIVMHGKDICKTKPHCGQCGLRRNCNAAVEK